MTSMSTNSSFEGTLDSQGLYNGDGILTIHATTYEGNFRHGTPTAGNWFISTPTTRYSGQARATKGMAYPQPHGSGTLKIIASKEVFIGQFQDGKKHGTGTFITAEDTIHGRWSNDVLCDGKGEEEEETHKLAPPPQQGHGSIATQNGSTYVGFFTNGLRHGTGVYVDAVSSVKYEGEWLNDKRHGRGLLFDGDGKMLFDGDWCADKQTSGKCFDSVEKWSYEGELLLGQFHGQGTLIDAAGHSYVGSWDRGKKSGFGCEKSFFTSSGSGSKSSSSGGGRSGGHHSSGSNNNRNPHSTQSQIVYIGQWLNGCREGEGEILFPDGSGFQGEWHAHKKHGNGTETCSNGDSHEGRWKMGVPIFDSNTEWTICYKLENEKYVGPCDDDYSPHGVGTFKYASGDLYKGSFLNGARHGKGIMYHASGDVEETVWIDGVTESLMSLLT